jgi:hypothetical protein
MSYTKEGIPTQTTDSEVKKGLTVGGRPAPSPSPAPPAGVATPAPAPAAPPSGGKR